MATKGGRVENLKTPTAEEAREKGAKGGRASAEARRRKKTMREVYESLRTLEVVPCHTEALQEMLQEKLPTVTVDEAIMLAMIAKAERGDVQAAQFIRDTAGEKPTDVIGMDSDQPFTISVKVIDEH